MASNLLTHLPLASTHKASIAFFLLIITIFVVPFFSLSTTSELIPSANTLPAIAYTLWVSLLDILTSSPFYFLLLNFLIVALVFLSGVLDPSSAGRESDGLDDEDLHQRGLHNYPKAAQMIHERLAFDELYGSQASSLPYLNIIESSLTYIAGDGAIGNAFGDEDEARIGKGKQIMATPIDSFSHEKPAFSDAGGSDSAEEGSSRGRVDATEEFFLTSGMVRDGLDIEKICPASSVVLKSEISHVPGVCKDIQAEENIQVCENENLHLKSDAQANADVNARTREHAADVIKTDNDVIADEDSNDVIHDEGGSDHIDDKHAHIEAEAEGPAEQRQGMAQTSSKTEKPGKQRPRIARTPSEPVRRRHRIARTPSEPTIAGNCPPQQRESDVGADMSRCMSLGRVEWLGVEKEKQEEEEEKMMSLSREELNERASAFISAFRKKLVSTAIDDASGQM